MPTTPGPLDRLPRPMSEREHRGRRSRRALSIGSTAGVLIAVGFVLATSGGGGPFDPVGAVAGAVGGWSAGAGPAISPRATSAPPDEAATAAPTDGPVAPVATATPTPTPTATPDPTAPAPETLTGYEWPLPGGRLTLPFGPTPWGSRIVDGEKFHDGIDLATFCGDRVVAAHAGTVLTAGRRYDKYMGWIGDLQPYLDRLEKKKLYPTLPIVVVVDDGNGYWSIYAHFSKVVVKKGDVIKAGQFLGYEGQTGRASGCHVHYGLFSPLETATFAIDPAVVKRMKVPKAEIARIDPILVMPYRPEPTPKATAKPSLTPPP
jgi:murein DD-endopeptidase MepM/ murein hydrolase activator NlpD